jgi:hypothetical protein
MYTILTRLYRHFLQSATITPFLIPWLVSTCYLLKFIILSAGRSDSLSNESASSTRRLACKAWNQASSHHHRNRRRSAQRICCWMQMSLKYDFKIEIDNDQNMFTAVLTR